MLAFLRNRTAKRPYVKSRGHQSKNWLSYIINGIRKRRVRTTPIYLLKDHISGCFRNPACYDEEAQQHQLQTALEQRAVCSQAIKKAGR